MIITLEQKVMEIKAEKQKLSDIIVNLSAEKKMVKLMWEGLESSKLIEPVQKEVQSPSKKLKCKVCECKFKDKDELKDTGLKLKCFVKLAKNVA